MKNVLRTYTVSWRFSDISATSEDNLNELRADNKGSIKNTLISLKPYVSIHILIVLNLLHIS
jgi:hypothetical protein